MLRPYQTESIDQVFLGWRKSRNSLLVLPTGAGKTVCFSHIVKKKNVPTVVIAHRQELVSQMSLALGSMGVPHNLICSDSVLHQIVRAQRMVLGKVWYDPNSLTSCAGVDTLIKRDRSPSFDKVGLWVIDEAHHLLRNNKWGKAVSLFPNAFGLGVTATPLRADGKGLGEHADGFFHNIVEGPTGNDLIEQGYLSPYECAVCKPEDLDFSQVEHGADGDFKQNQLRTATKASKRLVGSIVSEYKNRAMGKLGITFCVDIEHAEETTRQYNEAGVPALLVTGKTGVIERTIAMQKFKRREVLQLVNVDLFGEGVDVPDVEVVSMGRRTDSFPLFSQQFGRALRPVYLPGVELDTSEKRKAAIQNGGKPKALIIDHVGNILHHRLPTGKKEYTLDRREKKYSKKVLDNSDKLRVCLNATCAKPYLAFHTSCPFCGHNEPPPKVKPKNVEQVDGDLILLDEAALAELNRESERVMNLPFAPKGLPIHAVAAIIKRHGERTKAQTSLREVIARWGGIQTHQKKLSVREAQKLFFLSFGIDVLTAQTLGSLEAKQLQEKVERGLSC